MSIGELIQRYLPMALNQLQRLTDEEYLQLRDTVVFHLYNEDERRGLR